MLFFKELDREKNNVSVHMERQKSTQSHSKPKEESMTAGIVVMTSDHTTEIHTRQEDQRNRTKKPTKVSKYAAENKDSLFKRAVTAKLDISL